jgi:hypothetical protein
VHDDDVGLEELGADEVGDDALDVVAAAEELGRRLLVSARELDVRGPGGTGLEQLELQRADPSSDLEHRCAMDVAGERDEVALGPVQPAAAVAAQVARGERAIEEPAVVAGAAADTDMLADLCV